MEIIRNTVNCVYSEYLYSNNYNIATIIVNIIDACNYSCYYCYNKKPRTNKVLDLNKLYNFCKWYYDNINRHINICILGGEPTLHKDLLNFCKCISSTFSEMKCIVITNFSQDLNYYLDLLNTHTNLILSWHSLQNNDIFIDKVNSIPYHYFKDDMIKISVMYEKMNIQKSLYVFDTLYHKFYKYMEFSIVENNHLHGKQSELYEYTDEELDQFNQRINNKTYFDAQSYKHITFEYNDRIEKKILSQTLLDKKLVDFHNYKCMAGVDQLQIYFNGDIAPCDDLYETGVILGNIYSDNFDKSKYHYRICQLHNCPCPAFSKKLKIF